MSEGHDDVKEWAILAEVVENTNDAFVTIDRHHKVLFFNKAAERIFGYQRDEVLGRDLDVIMAPSCSRDHRKAVARYIETRVPTRIGHNTEIMATRKDGEQFPADISFSVSDVGDALYFTAIVRDLTETKALREQIRKSERLAAMGQLVAEITHEIKNPLMLIGGFVSQLIRRTDDEKSISKLNIVVDEVRRLENLLSELKELYFSQAPDAKEIDLNPLLKDVFALVKGECDTIGINATLDIEGEAVPVKGDERRLKQVFLNLMKNGVEALEKGGQLSVRASVGTDSVEIVIEDDGCGISLENMERVFDPFFTTKSSGSGLGLSVTKRIIEDHQGSRMSLESQEGKGTTIKVTMPLER